AAPASSLTMDLFAPGMTALHRAGLAGLLTTLRYIERAAERGQMSEVQLPGCPWEDGSPPWEYDAQSVTLKFGDEGSAAGQYFGRLFEIAYSIRDDMVFLPGQYGDLPPALPFRSALQDGILCTFYDYVI